MLSGITLASSIRCGLSSVKTLASQMSSIQNRLSTGKKVNSAIDNASSYYQARSLNSRAADLEALLDSMGQGIQTLQTAGLAIDKASQSFDQLSSIAQNALLFVDNTVSLDSSMSTLEIQQALNKGGRFSLADDITISQTLQINQAGTVIIGNGHSITYSGSSGFKVVNGENVSGDSAINITADSRISGLTVNYSNSAAQGAAVTVAGATADIDNITVNGTTSADRLYGIQALNGGKVRLDNVNNINLEGAYSEKLVNGNPDMWAGEYNTDMIVNQMGADNIAAYACKNFVPSLSLSDDENFGQGTWYLPSLGELADMYGTDYSQITAVGEGPGTTGAIGDNKAKINSALVALKAKGVAAEQLTNGYYWSSSENYYASSWGLTMYNGYRGNGTKTSNYYVRAFQLLENCFPPLSLSAAGGGGAQVPQIGDVMYADMSFGKAEDYDGSKEVVGVIAAVSEDGASVKIVNLQNLTVSTDGSGNQTFNAADPYGGANKTMKWQNSAYRDEAGNYHGTDITAVKDYYWTSVPNIYTAIAKGRGEISVANTIVEALTTDTQSSQDQFNEIMGQYDSMIADASYQGINLLQGGSLKVVFNETRSHFHTIKGYNADAEALGIQTAKWDKWEDVQGSIAQLQTAVDNLRNISSSLGNHLGIIQTRQNFTDSLIDVLETGADNLTLADMNEESADYLAIQTRQNLAINSLSLAAQSAQGILSLF